MAVGTGWGFGSLVRHLRDRGSPGWGETELLGWLEQRRWIVAELHAVGRADNHRRRLRPGDDLLADLYALSRLVDILIAPHQPINDDPALLDWTTGWPWWPGPLPAATAWAGFRAALGATAIAAEDFHPFFHEIVAVQSADDPDATPSLVGEHWPGALIGALLLVRSGVTVRAGRNQLNPAVAARSCLYWAWWRRNRKVVDLSHGWGHNSQWATDFRRDYLTDEDLHYNIDGIEGAAAVDLHDPADDLPEADRLDLLRYRHGLRTDLGHDQWPYQQTLIEPRRRPGTTIVR